jgi:K+-transporting ATPase KdpF subunit
MRVRIPSRAGQASVNPRPWARAASEDRIVIENLVAVVIGLALLVYLGYALARPDRF